jgi:hypothetical protein
MDVRIEPSTHTVPALVAALKQHYERLESKA